MKKYLSIFLIFFLLFAVSVPAFAETTDVIPPNLENLPYDNYIITDFSGSYFCYLYDNNDWSVYVSDERQDSTGSYRYIYLVSFSDTPSTIYSDIVGINSYNPNNSNNGWDTFSQTSTRNGQFNDGSSYIYCLLGCQTIIDSNKTLYFGYIDLDTKQVVHDGVFFSAVPLVVAMEEALTQFQTQTSHNLMIIALCGVGCLALLISLPLLKRVFSQFLNK